MTENNEGGSNILVRGPAEFDPKGGLSPKFAKKLPSNCMIFGGGDPGPAVALDPLVNKQLTHISF